MTDANEPAVVKESLTPAPIDLGIIRFEPMPNAGDEPMLVAAVSELETYVTVTVDRHHPVRGFTAWRVLINGDEVIGDFIDPRYACMAGLAHLIIYAVDVTMEVAGLDDQVSDDRREQDRRYRDWLKDVVDRLRTRQGQLPDSINQALNTGDGVYRP